MSPPVPPARGAPRWADVLDHIQQALELTLARTPTSPPAVPPPDAVTAATEWQRFLGQLDGHAQGLRACVARAEECARRAEALLTESARELEGWRAEVQQARGKLAKLDDSCV